MFVGWLVRNWRDSRPLLLLLWSATRVELMVMVFIKYLNSHLEDVRRILQTIENSGGTRQTNTN